MKQFKYKDGLYFIRSTVIKSDGKRTKSFLVSTVELPISNYGYPFETLVFPIKRGKTSMEDIAGNRYKTEEEAKRGHAEMCEEVLNGTVRAS